MDASRSDYAIRIVPLAACFLRSSPFGPLYL